MANIAFDTFTGANGTDIADHTPDVDVIGGGWIQAGVDEVELDGSGAVKFFSSADSAWIDVGTTDQIAKINTNAGGVDNRVQLVVRSDNNGGTAGTNYSFNVRPAVSGASNIFLYKRIVGASVELASAEITLSASTTYELELSVIGSELSAKIDGVEQLTATDSEISTGTYTGFYHALYTDNSLRVYDFQATDASLESQGFTLLGNLKVPAVGGATSSDTPLLIKNADFTAAMIASLKADGGDLRISTDSAGLNRLPIDVVDNLDVIWTLVPSVAVDTLIYIWGNDPAATQPAVEAAFGRDAVYQNEISRYHLSTGTGNAIDSKGVEDGILVGGTTSQSAPIAGFGNSTFYNEAPYYIRNDPFSGKSTFGAAVWQNLREASVSHGILGAWDSNTPMSVLWWITAGNVMNLRVKNTSGTVVTAEGATVLTVGQDYHLAIKYDGSTIKTYIDGVEDASAALTGVVATSSVSFLMFNYNSSGPTFQLDGYAQELAIGDRTQDQISIEYDNQSAATSWWIAEDAANDLGTQGFTNLGTLKVPSLGAGVTAANVPLLIKAADLTTAMVNNLKADWGDLRVSTDLAGNNQLPLDIVEGGSIAWTLVPSVAVDTLIYIWGNKPAAVKEGDTDTFGRDAVYVDEINRFHMNGELGNLTDSKGVEDATKFGTPVLGSNIAGYGSSVNFNAATRYTLSDPFSGRATFSACGWINKNAQSGFSQGVLGAWNGNAEMSVLVFNGSNDNFLVRVANSSGSFVTCTTATEFFDGTPKWWYVEYDGSNVRLYVNNILQDTQPLTGNVDTTVTPFEFGRYGLDDIRLWPSSQQEVSFRPTTTSSNQRSIEYQNQSANDAWWIAEDAAGGVIVSPTGVQTTISEGSVTVGGGVIVSPTGVQTTISEGSVTVTAAASASVTGVQTTVSEGNVTVGGGVIVSPTGVQTTISEGSVTVTAAASAPVTGVQTTISEGSVTVISDDGIPVTGVQALIEAGNIVVTTNATVPVTGTTVTIELGTVSAGVVTDVEVTGVQTTVVLGNVSVRLDTNVDVTGVETLIQLSGVNVWGIIPTDQDANWQENNTAQTPNWKNIGL